MNNRRGIFLDWHVGLSLIAIAFFALPSTETPACGKTSAPLADDVRITRSDGDVTITIHGPMMYLVRGFRVIPVRNFWPWMDRSMGDVHIDLTTSDGEHRIQNHFRSAQTLTLLDVVCPILKQEPKRLTSNFAVFVLVKGPDAEPGGKLSVKGTITWNNRDGEGYFFHEAGTGRVWKTVSATGDKR